MLPVFALANAGVTIDGATLSAALDGRVAIGIALALVAGNAVGIRLGCWIAVRLGLARLPDGVTRRDVCGVALLAGIGFTVSIFIATLAFEDPRLVDAAKLGILAGSVAAAALGTAVLTIGRRRGREPRALADETFSYRRRCLDRRGGEDAEFPGRLVPRSRDGAEP